MIRLRKHNKGFTLVELLVCVVIFVIMTALLVVKYGNFNQNILVTNLAYDTALAIRTAQNYGLSVKAAETTSCASGGSSDAFQCAYGVEFNSAGGNSFFMFAHVPITSETGMYVEGTDSKMTTYNMKSGAVITGYCFNENDCSGNNSVTGQLDILFKRPDPTALIYYNNNQKEYVKIMIQGTDGTKRNISIRSNGQISVDI